uniref:Uncharacterized protein n=1 Tax=Siphoviridae sp. ctXmm2 TaxID=2825546 RepID=A0A8S5QJL5_9CAUD|nr:MAG TPA: hypothetical protein [Siphoviridae sp. ctXmm2]
MSFSHYFRHALKCVPPIVIKNNRWLAPLVQRTLIRQK